MEKKAGLKRYEFVQILSDFLAVIPKQISKKLLKRAKKYLVTLLIMKDSALPDIFQLGHFLPQSDGIFSEKKQDKK